MIRGVIFDCDRILLDAMPPWQEATARCLSGLDIRIDETLGAKFFEMTMPESAQVIRGEFNLDSTVEEITTGIYETVARGYHDRVGLKPRAKEFIKVLTRCGIPLAVASFGSEALIRPALARLGLEQNFIKILASSETELYKRQPDMFLIAAWLMGAGPEDIWVFKDVLYVI